MQSCVTVSLVPEARGGPFVFWDDLSQACWQASELGFDAIEIFPPDAETLERCKVEERLAEHGLKLAAVGTGAGWVRHGLTLTDPLPEKRRAAIDFVRSLVNTAGRLGAPVIIGSMQGRHNAQVDRLTALGYLRQAFEELGQLAATWNAPLLYEPLNRYETNLCNTLETGLELIETCGPNVRLLADLFHMNMEEVDVAAALRRASSRLGHVHFVDSNRRAAGWGHTRFEPIIQCLRAIDYDGYLSAEAFAWPDSLAAARQTMSAYRSLVEQP